MKSMTDRLMMLNDEHAHSKKNSKYTGQVLIYMYKSAFIGDNT
jgi:hypothetical protein